MINRAVVGCMSSASAKVVAKGSNFIGLLKAVEKMHGSQPREQVLSMLTGELATTLLHGQLLAMAWYPVAWYGQLHAAIDSALGGGPALARTLGREATLVDFGGLHRLIASMLKVETLFGQSHRLMGLYWRGGKIERLEVSSGRAKIRFASWPGFTRLIWEDIMGSTEGLLDICGGKDPRCRASKPLDQREAPDTLEIDVRWS